VLAGDLEGAEAELVELVQLDSGDPTAYMALAQLYRARGEVGRALQVHQNLLLRGDLSDDDRTRVQLALGDDLRRGGYRQRAIVAYRDVFEANPHSPAARDALVSLYAEDDQPAQALAVIKEAAGWLGKRDTSREGPLLTQLAYQQRSEGRIDEARRTARRAIKRDASAACPFLLLGELELERGRSKAALTAFKQAARLSNEDADALWLRVETLYSASKHRDDFEAFVREHLASAPGHRAATRALARCVAACGDVDGALLSLRGLLDADPRDDRSRAAFGRLLLADGRSTDALKAYEDWIEVVAPAEPSLELGEGSS
jgi:lipopolysaccharide biosynthesis regulator YciM